MGTERWDGGWKRIQCQERVKNGDTRKNLDCTTNSTGKRGGLKKQSSWRGERNGMQSIGGEVGCDGLRSVLPLNRRKEQS